MVQVFISHASKDREFVEREIVDLLRKHGIKPWYSTDDIPSAQQWERAIQKGLEDSDWFLLVMSSNSAVSEYVKDELHMATEFLPDRIIPVVISPFDPAAFPMRMRRLQHIDFQKPSPECQKKLLAIWGAKLRHQPSSSRPESRAKTGDEDTGISTQASPRTRPPEKPKPVPESADDEGDRPYSMPLSAQRKRRHAEEAAAAQSSRRLRLFAIIGGVAALLIGDTCVFSIAYALRNRPMLPANNEQSKLGAIKPEVNGAKKVDDSKVMVKPKSGDWIAAERFFNGYLHVLGGPKEKHLPLAGKSWIRPGMLQFPIEWGARGTVEINVDLDGGQVNLASLRGSPKEFFIQWTESPNKIHPPALGPTWVSAERFFSGSIKVLGGPKAKVLPLKGRDWINVGMFQFPGEGGANLALEIHVEVKSGQVNLDSMRSYSKSFTVEWLDPSQKPSLEPSPKDNDLIPADQFFAGSIRVTGGPKEKLLPLKDRKWLSPGVLQFPPPEGGVNRALEIHIDVEAGQVRLSSLRTPSTAFKVQWVKGSSK